MSIVTKPNPLPSELSYVPADTAPYKVMNNDSWYSLAERPEVKATGMSASDLCYLNFKTKKPSEINWYLYNKIGCRMTTQSGKNYMFSNGDQPGIIYLPKAGPPPPVTEIKPVMPEARLNSWAGLGIKAGTQFVVVGIETLTGYVVSFDDPHKGMAIGASINRLGPGIGASGGLCLIYVTGVSRPDQLNGFQQDGTDFNLSIGGNWGKAAQAVSKAKKFQPLISVIGKLGARTPGALKAALAAHPDTWVEMVKAGKAVNEGMGIDINGDPNVFIVDIPFAGAGVEASVFYGITNFNALWDFTE